MSEDLKVRVSVRFGSYARRDKFAAWLANQALRLASRRYRAMVKGAIALGLETAAMEPRAEKARHEEGRMTG